MELKYIRDELEARVASRTAELFKLNCDLQDNIALLKSINAELKAFSYSISHDLKTPTIAVEGFSQILLERYGHRLDKKGKNFGANDQGKRRSNAELIDNLLAYSALGRKTQALHDRYGSGWLSKFLTSSKPYIGDTPMSISIKPAPPANADKTMIRQVMLNLLGNAIKYSRVKEQSDVKFGGWSEPGRVVYCSG